MNGQHTPGPWQQRDDQTSEGWVTIIGNVDGEYVDGVPHCTYDVICRCEDEYGERLPNVSANARLIAAAPDLAEAAKQALAVLDRLTNPVDGDTSSQCFYAAKEAATKARAALSKAGAA